MFSDGYPAYEFGVGAGLLLLSILLARIPVLARQLDDAVARISRFWWRRGLFTLDDPEIEQRRLDLLRLLLGLFVCRSASRDLASALTTGDPAIIAVQAFAFGLALCILLGVAAPVAALGLGLSVNLVVDNVGRSNNLGSMALSTTLMILAFAPVGRRLSVDAWLLRREGPIGGAWRALYGAWGPLTIERAAFVKGCGLVAFSTILFHAALLHLFDPAWTTGYLNVWVLLGPSTNPSFNVLFDRLYEASPFLFITFAQVSTYGTIAWELALLPLVLMSRWTRAAAILWGVGFSLTVALVLPLRMLGWYWLVLWAVLFWNSWKLNAHGRDRVVVFADDARRGLLGLLRRLDVFGVIDLREAKDGAALVAGASAGAAVSNVVGATSASRSGLDLYAVIAGRVLLALPLAPPLALAARLRSATQSAAPAAAFLPPPAAPAPADSSRPTTVGDAAGGLGGLALPRALLLAFGVLLAAHLVRLPIVREQPVVADLAGWSRGYVGQAPLVFGIGPVDVFNKWQLDGVRYTVYSWWTVGDQQAGDLEGVLSSVSTVDMYTMARHYNEMAHRGLLCGSDALRQSLADLGRRYAYLRVPSDRLGDARFHARFWFDDWPTVADLEAYRYQPVRRLMTCSMTSTVASADQLSVAFTDAAGALLARHQGLPFSPPAERVGLVYRYPCDAEIQWVSGWYNRPDLGVGTPAAQPQMQALLSDRSSKTSITCMLEVAEVQKVMNLEWGPENPPPPRGSCQGDLELAGTYFDAVFDDQLRARTRAALERATASHHYGDLGACLLATAEVRRAYMDAIRGG